MTLGGYSDFRLNTARAALSSFRLDGEPALEIQALQRIDGIRSAWPTVL